MRSDFSLNTLEIQIPASFAGVAWTWIKVDRMEILKLATVTSTRKPINWSAFGKSALQNSTRERHMSPRHPQQ